ncbi:hypothetical protein GCM10011383_44650 [Hymenobacter cavernae]|uniref:CopG family transcriptional regulator n=2 Tax=Hymenobacter cavernae TaxID=2044852 RepID=A0ABQ1UWN8_9BACT|nr:hypothetical protein GCM10011383_44650 [Hymenobacter cavernae]
MAVKSKPDLDQLIPTSSPDDLLLKPKTPAVIGTSLPGASPTEITKIKYSSILPSDVWKQLHQLSFWDRKDLSVIIEAALIEYFKEHPDAQRELPEEEKRRRRLL